MIKLFKRILKLPEILKWSFVLTKSERLQSQEKDQEALMLLLSVKDILEGKNFEYHLNLARVYVNGKKDFLASIKEYKIAISLIEDAKIINADDREYLLTYSKYMVAWALNDLGEKDKAEHWRTECEKHSFNCNKVRNVLRRSFPMEWHVDYKL